MKKTNALPAAWGEKLGNGFGGGMQHPEIEVMRADEYEAYIDAPLQFLVEGLMPRIYTELNAPQGRAAKALAQGYASHRQVKAGYERIVAELVAEYGYSPRLCKGSPHHSAFSFDRSVMDIKSIDISKLLAVLEWVRENAVY